MAAGRLTRRRLLLAAVAVALLGATGRRWTDMGDGTRIAIGIWDGVEELDVVGPYEVLAAWASSRGGEVEVVTVADSSETISAAHGLQLRPDTTWDTLGRPDVLVLPGGASGRQLTDEGFLERLRGFAADGTLMTSVCTGALVFAAAGLLDGKPATTHWSAVESLAGYGVDVRPDERFVDAGAVVTAAGVSAGIDMALHLVARLQSRDAARDVKRYIQYDPEPPV